MPFVCAVNVMMDFKWLTKQLLETYLGSDTLSEVEIQVFWIQMHVLLVRENKNFLKILSTF